MRLTSIGELFPSLDHCASEQIDSRHLDRRALNSLGRQGCTTWGDLQKLRIGDLWDTPNAGQLTVERIVAAAKEQAAVFGTTGLDFGQTTAPHQSLAPPSANQMSVAQLAEMRMSSIGDLFPSLDHCASEQIDSPHIDQRAVTSLRRAGCRTWGDLQRRRIGDLWAISNAGQLTVERIVAAAKEQAALFGTTGMTFSAMSGPVGTLVPPTSPSAGQVTLARFAEMLAQWASDSRGAASVADLLAGLSGPLPSDVAAAFETVSALPLVDVVPALVNTDDQAQLIIDFLDEIGPDSRFVVARCIASPSGSMPTLESIADTEDVTRERIRQLVNRGLASVEECRGREAYRLLSWRAGDLRSTLGALSRAGLSVIDEAIVHAARGFSDPDGCTAKEFMLWFAGEYRRDGDWWVSGDLGRVDAARRSLRAALENEWLLDRASLEERFAEAGVGADLTDVDIAFLSGWRAIGGEWWIRWDGALGDKAERVLRLALRAISASEMNELIGEGHALSSVQNVLSADNRFMRVSMDLTYALTEWKWEEYSTAAQEIVERIERAGGEAVLDDVVIELFNHFGLKEGTVRAYAASPAFVVNDGMIRLRGRDEEIAVNDRVASAEGLYLRPDGCVVFHLPVDADVLRGSGRSIPNPLSVTVGVRPGDVRDFSTGAQGRVRVSWPATAVTGAAIGSTRALVEQLDAKIGDVVRFVFDLDAESVEGFIVSGSSLSDLTGLSLTPGGEAAELAAAIRVDPLEVRAALSERGDGVVAALIPAAKKSKGLDDALSRLDGLLG